MRELPRRISTLAFVVKNPQREFSKKSSKSSSTEGRGEGSTGVAIYKKALMAAMVSSGALRFGQCPVASIKTSLLFGI
jgi:hypothetical protein